MKTTYVYRSGGLVEITREKPDAGVSFISDIQPYQSMIDGHMVTSRSEHRAHLRENNCIEIGNESMETKVAPPTDNRREILRAQLANMTHDQANKILAKARDDVRFTRR